MTADYVYLPFSKSLYNDIVRLSDGSLDPARLAEQEVLNLIERNLDDLAYDWFGERLREFAEIYFPSQVVRWDAEDSAVQATSAQERLSLVWKEVTVPHGAEVRMQYSGKYHYARVVKGRIEDDGKLFSPSEWASKIASGTSRNAWRDIWFKDPLESQWIPATVLRDRAHEALQLTNDRGQS